MASTWMDEKKTWLYQPTDLETQPTACIWDNFGGHPLSSVSVKLLANNSVQIVKVELY